MAEAAIPLTTLHQITTTTLRTTTNKIAADQTVTAITHFQHHHQDGNLLHQDLVALLEDHLHLQATMDLMIIVNHHHLLATPRVGHMVMIPAHVVEGILIAVMVAVEIGAEIQTRFVEVEEGTEAVKGENLMNSMVLQFA
jgi:hypothetical protein